MTRTSFGNPLWSPDHDDALPWGDADLGVLAELPGDSTGEALVHTLEEANRCTELDVAINDENVLHRSLRAADVFGVRDAFFATEFRTAAEMWVERLCGPNGEGFFQLAETPVIHGFLQWTWTGLTAAPYLLDGPTATVALGDGAPDPGTSDPGTSDPGTSEPGSLAELRLPQRHMLVMLEHPIEIEPGTSWFSDEEVAAASARFTANRAHLAAHGMPPLSALKAPIEVAVARRGGRFYGMMLNADAHGVLHDAAGWLIAAAGATPREWQPQAVYGQLSEATLAPLAHRLAGAVAGATWAPAATVDTEALHAIRDTDRFRDLVQQPDVVGVHTVIGPKAA